MRLRVPPIIALLLGLSYLAAAQTITVSCPHFFDDRHQAVSCVEALLSQDDYHFALAPLPPSNGFGPGLVLTKKFRGIAASGNEYALDLSATGAVTTNSSWLIGGDLRWVPPLPYRPDASHANGFRLWKFSSVERFNLHTSAIHRTVRTLFFNGIGSRSPTTRFLFAEDDTAFEVDGQLPLTRWLVAKGQTELRRSVLPRIGDADAVRLNFPAAGTPGILSQPIFVHDSLGASTAFSFRKARPFEELPKQDTPHFQTLVLFSLMHDVSFHWWTPLDGQPFSYSQFVYEGDERMNFRRVLRNFFPAEKHPVVRYLCQGNKRRDECDFGQFDVKTRLVLSQVGGNNQIPFYLQPTLGGTDADSQVTLRGYDNYRFRAPDLALFQAEYGMPVYDPIGVFVFYDAGSVGRSAGELSLAQVRQDSGFGLSVRLRGNIVAQTYYAFGAGHGGRWNYNFAKSF